MVNSIQYTFERRKEGSRGGREERRTLYLGLSFCICKTGIIIVPTSRITVLQEIMHTS